jgi:SAM-dependent methyltransferase
LKSIEPSKLKTPYDGVAHEYYEADLHPTCNNFNFLSRIYLQCQLDAIATQESVLETGAGASLLAELLHYRRQSLRGLKITDSSSSMLSYSARWEAEGAELAVLDAEEMELAGQSFDFVVSILGDPYNTLKFWREVGRVLRRNGLVVFTMPSFHWSSRYREAFGAGVLDSADFLLRSGRTICVPSVIPPLQAQIEMMQSAGLQVINFEDLGADRLDGSVMRSSKIEVFGAEPSSLVWGFVARNQGTQPSRDGRPRPDII